MNKYKLILVITVVVASLAGCGSKYDVDISYLPDDLIQHHEEQLQEYKDQYGNAEDGSFDQSEFANEVGFRYMSLGQYEDAIMFYEKVLEYDPVHFPALNNIAVMYEKVEENVKALEYQKRLYESNSVKQEVVSDTIRLLLKNDQKEDAIGLLETYAITDAGKDSQKFVSDEFEGIMNFQAPKK